MTKRKINLLAAAVAGVTLSFSAIADMGGARNMETPNLGVHGVQTPTNVNEAAPANNPMRVPGGVPTLPATAADAAPGFPANPMVGTAEPQFHRDGGLGYGATGGLGYGATGGATAGGAVSGTHAVETPRNVREPAPAGAMPGSQQFQSGQPAIPAVDRPSTVSESAPERTGERTAAPFAGDSRHLPNPTAPSGVSESGTGVVGGEPARGAAQGGIIR
jgi:hypothetical protein